VRDRGGHAVRTRQLSPDALGNDDWKAGVFAAGGLASLRRFNAARQISVLGWFKVTGDAPAPNTNTPDPADRYNAVGLAGVLSGDSDGHNMRALLEVIDVSGELVRLPGINPCGRLGLTSSGSARTCGRFASRSP
jgi:hypothetical protein